MTHSTIGLSHKAAVHQPLSSLLTTQTKHNLGAAPTLTAANAADAKAKAAIAANEEKAESPAHRALEAQSSTKVTISAAAKLAAAKEEAAETPSQKLAELALSKNSAGKKL